MPVWLVALVVLAVGRASAQSATVSILSPRDGSSVASSTLARPRGTAGSSSGVRGVQVLLQRAGGAKWLSWNGTGWSAQVTPVDADYSAASRSWAWPGGVALPASTLLAPGSYRLQVVARAVNGSILGRAESRFSVEGSIARMDAPANDTPQNATPISGATGTARGTNVGAIDHNGGSAAGEPGNAQPDVFWKWTAPAEGPAVATFDTNGSGFNTAMWVLKRNLDGTLTVVGTDDDGGDDDKSLVRFGTEAGSEYLIEVFGPNHEVGDIVLNWTAALRPANDSPLNATPISGATGSVRGSNVNAVDHNGGSAAGEPGNAQPDVFWKWTAPAGGPAVATFNTNGSSFNTGIWVLRHNPDGTLTLVASDDDSGDGDKSLVSFEAEPNRSYRIEVYGPNHEVGDIVLNWTSVPRPANDLVRRATPIKGATGSVTGSNVNALAHDWVDNVESSEPDVFWKWTPPVGGPAVVTFDTVGSSFPGVLYVHDGRNQIVTNAPTRASFSVVQGRLYTIAVIGAGGRVGAIVLNWKMSLRPTNDTAPLATAISNASGSVRGTNADALGHDMGTNEDGSEPEVFWKWRAPTFGAPIGVFSTNGSSFDTMIAVHRRRPSGAYDQIARDDDSGDGNRSLVRFAVEPGREYLIEVSGKGRATGTITLNWSTAFRPTNDLPQKATIISGGAGQVTASSVDSLPHGPNGLGESGGGDVWWKWGAPAGRKLPTTFGIDGSNFNGGVAVWLSEGPGAYTLVGRDDTGSQRNVAFESKPGREYLIEVYGNSSGVAGHVVLNWNQVSTGTVRGRILNQQGGGQVARLYLVPGYSIRPLLSPDTLQNVRQVISDADGMYSFDKVVDDVHLVVPFTPGKVFDQQSLRVTPQPGVTIVANFRVASLDPTGPTVTVGSLERATSNGAFVVAKVSGSVSDSNTLAGQPVAGVFRVIYSVCRLDSDAAALKLPPGLRRVNAVYSRGQRGFVSASDTAATRPSLDNTFVANMVGSSWTGTFEDGLKAALASPGTYRVAVLARDKAFNLSLNASNSTDPNQIANGNYTFAHFETTTANLGVLRTLPLSVPNGETITYAFSIMNSGNLPLQNVRVRQTLNTNKTVLNTSSISPPASQFTATDVIWDLGTIAPHSTKLLQLNVRASAGTLGENIWAGNLSVTADNEQDCVFAGDNINIESSTWVIGGALNGLRSLGDSIGRTINNFVFGSSARDRAAQADLGTIKNTSGVTRLAGVDALRFGIDAMLIGIGNNQMVAAGGGNMVAAGGGNMVAAGGGNMVAAGGGNMVTINGLQGANILSRLVTDPASLLGSSSSFAPGLKGANMVAAGGGNMVAAGGGNMVAAGGGNFVSNTEGLIAQTRIKLVGQDGASLVGQDGGSFKLVNGAGLVNLDLAAGLKMAAGRGNTLVGQDGGSFIGAGAVSLIRR
jgi:uncharacterized repeat protein (TIGR01451 family)